MLFLVILLLFGYLDTFAAVDALKPCKEDQCVPNCICGFSDADVCALEYGKWGWVAPYDNLRPKVRKQL